MYHSEILDLSWSQHTMDDYSSTFDISRCRKKGMIGYLGHKEIDAGKNC